MFNPNYFSISPDHYEEQQVQQLSDALNLPIWNPSSVYNSGVQNYNKDIRFYEGRAMYDKIDESFPVHVRVVQNGKYIWQDEVTKNIYQVDGYPIGDCEFDLEKLTYEYCNPPISVGLTVYDFTGGTAFTGDETVLRDDHNIFHFDAFKGQKKTVWPKLNIETGDFYESWYYYWVYYWGYFNTYYYHSPIVIGWYDSYTNVDSIHMTSFYGWNYGTSNVQCLFSSFDNIIGYYPVVDDYLYPCFLSPYVSLYFPPNTQFPTGWTNYGGYNGDPVLKETYTGYRIVGATFDGFNLVLRPYSFSNSGIVNYFEGQGAWSGYEAIPYDAVCVPPDYGLWPWKSVQEIYAYNPTWVTYSVYLNTQPWYGWWWWGGFIGGNYYNLQSGFALKKAGATFTKLSPEIQNYDGGYSVYIYRNVIIYGDNPRIQPLVSNSVSTTQSINWYTRAAVVDVYVSFKKQQFPDIGSIPNIDQVKKMAVNAINFRELDYRDFSFRDYEFRAYIPLSTSEARQYVYPYMQDYTGDYIDDPYWYLYFGYSVFEWASYNYIYSSSVYTFYAYDPLYQYLYQPDYMDMGSFEPGIISAATNAFSWPDKNEWFYSRDPVGNYYYYYSYYDQYNFLPLYFGGSIPFTSNIGVPASLNIELTSNNYNYGNMGGSTKLNAKANIKYDYEYTESPTRSLFINTLGNISTYEYYGSERMQDKFAEPGFGDGWFRIVTSGDSTYPGGYPYRINEILVVDPNGNYLSKGVLNAENVPDSRTPYSDRDLIPPYYGNFTIDEYDYTNRIYYWWFYSSEQSSSPFQNGILAGDKPNAYLFKPFGTHYQGYPNNSKYCTDGIYLVINRQYHARQNINSGFSTTYGNPNAVEYPIGAFYISTENSGFQIYDVPLYYVPNLDLSKPYAGIMNASFSCYQNNQAGYYSDLDGKPEIYLSADYDQDMVNKLVILGPNGQQLTYGVDYEIDYQQEFNLGNFRIRFLNTLGFLYDNEPTGNPPHLSDGEYKIFIPKYKQMYMTCNAVVENYSSLKPRFLRGNNYYYYYNFISEFYTISNNVYSNINPSQGYYFWYGFQFYIYDNGVYNYGNNTISNYYLLSLSPIVFVITDCIFHGSINNVPGSFKCDILFQEYLEQYELPVNPEGFNQLLNGSISAQGGYNY